MRCSLFISDLMPDVYHKLKWYQFGKRDVTIYCDIKRQKREEKSIASQTKMYYIVNIRLSGAFELHQYFDLYASLFNH